MESSLQGKNLLLFSYKKMRFWDIYIPLNRVDPTEKAVKEKGSVLLPLNVYLEKKVKVFHSPIPKGAVSLYLGHS